MPLSCGCPKCYSVWTPREQQQVRHFVFNALYIDPFFLLAQEQSEEVIAATAVTIAVFGAKEGNVLYRNRFHDFYEELVGKIETEHDMTVCMQVWLNALERITPHKVIVRGAKIGEEELLRFRADQGRWKVGRAAAFYSYSIGTILYFSDQTEAVMAKIVLDTPTRHRNNAVGWQVTGTTSLYFHNLSPIPPQSTQAEAAV